MGGGGGGYSSQALPSLYTLLITAITVVKRIVKAAVVYLIELLLISYVRFEDQLIIQGMKVV